MNLLRNRRGAVAAMSAVVMIGVIGVAGFAIDLTRIWMVNARLKTAIDAASLVGARQISLDAATRDAQIQAIYFANITQNGRSPNWLGATYADPVITQIDDRRIQVSGSATVPTTLFSIIDRTPMTVGDTSVAQRQGTGLELALVLDVTGSMASNNNIAALRNAATDLVNILYAGQERQPDLWVSVVPYTAMVNIGRGREAWLQPGVLNQADYAPTVWRGCVEARAGGNYARDADQDETPPIGTNAVAFRPFIWPSDRYTYSADPAVPGNLIVRRAGVAVSLAPVDVLATDVPINRGDNAWIPGAGGAVITNATAAWSDAVWEPDPENPGTDAEENTRDNEGRSPNLGCGRAVLPLTRDRTPLLAQIAALRATRRGGTMANVGLQLGWGTISPEWRGAWNLGETREGQQLPLGYNTRFMRKAIVLMTDGENQWYDWPEGAPGRCNTNANPPRCVTTNPDFTTLPSAGVWTAENRTPPRWISDGDADQNAYGRLLTNRLGVANPTPGPNGTAVTDATNGINARMTRLCQAVRANSRNVTVYTIVFIANPSTAVQDLYRGCASAPENFFIAPTQADLNAAFRTIAGQLANLRLVQ
jgi:Flp pilus assembly protein TadG